MCVNYTHERIPRRIHCFRSSVACLNKQLFSKGAAGSFELRLGREKKAVTFEGAVNFGTPTQYAPVRAISDPVEHLVPRTSMI